MRAWPKPLTDEFLQQQEQALKTLRAAVTQRFEPAPRVAAGPVPHKTASKSKSPRPRSVDVRG